MQVRCITCQQCAKPRNVSWVKSGGKRTGPDPRLKIDSNDSMWMALGGGGRQTLQLTTLNLRCPGTLFISHENAIFLFSVFRVVQGEAKTPKIMGCCRANFAFLHALKIGTFRGK